MHKNRKQVYIPRVIEELRRRKVNASAVLSTGGIFRFFSFLEDLAKSKKKENCNE
jgi:hypothetical protein